MRISLLGPLHVDDVPGTVAIGAAKERSLLTTLALNVGAIVSTDALVRALWGEEPPISARKTLQTYISNLRQAVGADAITTHPSGYRLAIEPDDVDVHRFRALVRAGDQSLRGGDAAIARSQLCDALALWRGHPLTEVAPHTGLAGEAVRLEEEHLSALETRIAADLAFGANAELVGELESLVRDYPYRERLWGDLMVALYRCGRQAEALAAYQRARQQLVDELGLQPGGELRRIEEAILNQDPSLAATSSAAPIVAAGTTTGVLRSPVRYARSSGGMSIAYQVAGDGPIDILAIPGFVSHLDIWWNAPTDGLVRQLTSIGRLISFDKRGTGLSDRPESIAPLDWVDDTLAVLDAVGAKDVVVLGVSAGTPTAIRMAALHSQRVRALVIFGGGPRTFLSEDYEVGYERALVEEFAQGLELGWGAGAAIEFYAPSRANDDHVRDYWARYQQLSASPTAAMLSFWTAVNDDVIELLPAVETPTLVLHPEREIIAPVGWGRFLAEHIRGAEFVALDSDIDLICVSDVIDEMAAEIVSFLGRALPETELDRPDPALVTVVAVASSSAAAGREIAATLERLGGRVQPRPAVTAVFDSPGKALRASNALLRDFASHQRPRSGIGVGIHVGECVLSEVGYRGEAVDLAHRLAVQAQPDNEVVLTAVVRQLLSTDDVEFEPRAAIAAHQVLAVIVDPA